MAIRKAIFTVTVTKVIEVELLEGEAEDEQSLLMKTLPPSSVFPMEGSDKDVSWTDTDIEVVDYEPQQMRLNTLTGNMVKR